MIRKAFLFATLFAAIVSRGSAQTFYRGNCDVSPVVTPGHDIGVSCWRGWSEDGSLPPHVDLIRISEDDALALARGRTPKDDLAQGTAVASTTLADGTNLFAGSFVPPGPGAYAVRLYVGSIPVTALLTTVSTFGLMSVRSAGKILYAPIDLHTSTVHRGALRVIRLEGERPTALVAATDGLYEDRVPMAPDNGDIVYARAADGSLAIMPHSYGYWGESDEPERRAFFETDRPVYRPGDRVEIRAILREGSIGAYRVDRKPLVVDVTQSYPQRSVARRTLTPNAFGSVSTSVQLPLDAALGDYTVSIGSEQLGQFEVQAYKKPEYTLDVVPTRPYVIAGDDATFKAHFAYLFGASASNLKLNYSATIQYGNQYWYGPYSGRRSGTDYARESGDVTTDSSGDAEIRIPTKSEGLDATVNISVDGRDASGRTVTASAVNSVSRGTYRILIQPSSWVGEANKPSQIAVRTVTPDDLARPDASLRVRIVESRWVKYETRDVATHWLDIRTDARGETRFSFTPSEPGDYRYEVSGRDERGNDIAASQYQWVLSPNDSWAPNLSEPKLIADKTAFLPGEKLGLTLVLANPAREAIVAVVTDRLVEHRVVAVRGRIATLRLDEPRDAQSARVYAYVPGNSGVATASTDVAIAPPPTHLTVSVRPAKASYRPGDRAELRLHVMDDRGRAVHAEVSLGVVDEGIYALVDEQKVDPDEAFYHILGYSYGDVSWDRPYAYPYMLKTIAKVTSPSAGQLVKSGVGEDVYSVNAGAEAASAALGGGRSLTSAYSAIASVAGVAVRTKFVDTAYWTPNALTDRNGDATIAFTWPENLTTWRASAVAVTVATQFGTQKADVLVTKPLLARLEIPRFLRAGDTATITGIVHGQKAGAPVVMQFDPGPLATHETPVSLVFDANKRASASWNVFDKYVGTVDLALRATDGTESDGMQLPLPLLGATALAHEREAGLVTGDPSVPFVIGAGEVAGAMHVSFAPSMIAQIAQTVRVFDVYPYYCTEQTSSNGIVASALLLAGAKQENIKLPNDPKAVIAKARAKLVELRHNDNAWGWWTSDRTSLFMTAYALYAQDLMNRAVGPVDTSTIRTTAFALAKLMQERSASEPDDELALAAYALTRAEPEALPRETLPALAKRLDHEDALTLALVGLAAHDAGNTDLAQRAAQLLLKRGVSANGALFWHDLDWSWQWWSDPIEGAALGALLLHETGHETQAQQALAFIRAQRNGDWWYTTLDTAMASIAIAQIEGPDGASAPEETVRVFVDGKVAATTRITSLLPDAADTHIVIPASVMHDAHSVTIERNGTGRLYWSSDFEKYGSVTASGVRDASDGVLKRLFAKPPSFHVTRRYSVDHAGAWRVGDVVTCELSISSHDGAEYVTLEDPFPAGTEYQLPRDGVGWSWSGEQFLDDRAAFFFRRLPAGETMNLTYQLRATTPGTFTAPGPSAFASYGPPVSVVGTGERVLIVP